jgi:acetyl-CoA carboxylase carboxyl transferase subunit alpha
MRGGFIMTAYEKVNMARAKGRNTSLEFIKNIFTNFLEMHGDRFFADDKAIISGIAYLGKTPVTVIGIEKGKTIKDRAARNFGSAHPEGYRKALRQMKLAEKFSRPIICFVDTPGAYCGIGAEERGQGQAIASNLTEMMTLKTPIISVLIGEGGSGGALALSVANEVWMLENSVYSVISPEGCASILWKDASKVKEASECLKLTAPDLLSLGVIEKIIPEGDKLFERLKLDLIGAVEKYSAMEKGELTLSRYERFRKAGAFK